MYSLLLFGRMVADEVRTRAYMRALEQAVTPDAVVLDIGCGPGIFSLVAARLGARRVIAVDVDESIELARQVAADNGYADRIEFVRGMSTDLEIDEPADIIVSDLRGVLPLFRAHLPSIIDARARLLRPGGTLIPQRDSLHVAAVEAADWYADTVDPWSDAVYGFDLSRGRVPVTSVWAQAIVRPERLLTSPATWAVLDYRRIDSPDVAGEAALRVTRDGVGHGYAAWFDTLLTDGVGFSSGPGDPPLIYQQAFIPWREPVRLQVGDSLHAQFQADFVKGDYFWRWATCATRGDHTSPVARLDQSSLDALVVRAGPQLRANGPPPDRP